MESQHNSLESSEERIDLNISNAESESESESEKIDLGLNQETVEEGKKTHTDEAQEQIEETNSKRSEEDNADIDINMPLDSQRIQEQPAEPVLENKDIIHNINDADISNVGIIEQPNNTSDEKVDIKSLSEAEKTFVKDLTLQEIEPNNKMPQLEEPEPQMGGAPSPVVRTIINELSNTTKQIEKSKTRRQRKTRTLTLKENVIPVIRNKQGQGRRTHKANADGVIEKNQNRKSRFRKRTDAAVNTD